MTIPFDPIESVNVLAVLDLAQAMIRRFDGRIVYWTQGARDLYGWSADEAIGRLSHELLATQFPKPLAEIETDLLRDGQWLGQLRHRTRSGQFIHVVSHWALQRDAEGRPTAIAEVNTNLSLDDRAEAARIRLAAIVASSNDAIIGKTLEGYVTDWNVAAEKLFGYSAEEMIGRPVSVLFPADQVAEEATILERIAQGEAIPTFEAIRRHKDGSDIPVAVTISPVRDAAGRIVGASKIVRDLRERIDRDERLAEMDAELRHMARLSEMGQLAAAIVHEINQPLGAIKNYIGGLERLLISGGDDLVSHAVLKIREQTDRATGIIRRLHGFLRRSAPAVKTEDLASIVRDSIELASIDPAAKAIAFRAEILDRDIQVSVDRIQIQQVLFNLLRNAIEAMADSPVAVLTITSTINDKNYAVVSVADTGPGLAREVLENLFRPFTTTKVSGMGIGLSVCRTIIESHGGQLSVGASSKEGTVFRFTLPLAGPE